MRHFAFQDVQFLDTSGNNTEVTSDGLPVLGISPVSILYLRRRE
jgi:hypothetical protein